MNEHLFRMTGTYVASFNFRDSTHGKKMNSKGQNLSLQSFYYLKDCCTQNLSFRSRIESMLRRKKSDKTVSNDKYTKSASSDKKRWFRGRTKKNWCQISSAQKEKKLFLFVRYCKPLAHAKERASSWKSQLCKFLLYVQY